MRIGIVAPEFPPDIGGVETYSYEFSAELVRRGHQVTVFTHRHIVPGERLPGLTLKTAQQIADTAQRFGQDDDITVLALSLAPSVQPIPLA